MNSLRAIIGYKILNDNHRKEQTDVTIDAYIGLLLCFTQIHNMQITYMLLKLIFHKMYESLMKYNVSNPEPYETRESSVTCSYI